MKEHDLDNLKIDKLYGMNASQSESEIKELIKIIQDKLITEFPNLSQSVSFEWIKKMLWWLYKVKQQRLYHVRDFAIKLIRSSIHDDDSLITFLNQVTASHLREIKRKRDFKHKEHGFSYQIYQVMIEKFINKTDISGPVTYIQEGSFDHEFDSVQTKLMDPAFDPNGTRVFVQLGEHIGKLVGEKIGLPRAHQASSIKQNGLFEIHLRTAQERSSFVDCLVEKGYKSDSKKRKAQDEQVNKNDSDVKGHGNVRIQRSFYVKPIGDSGINCTFFREMQFKTVNQTKNPFNAMKILDGETGDCNFGVADPNMGTTVFINKLFGVIPNSNLREILDTMYDDLSEIQSKKSKLNNSKKTYIEKNPNARNNDPRALRANEHWWQMKDKDRNPVYKSSRDVDWGNTVSIDEFVETSSRRVAKTFKQLDYAESRIKAEIYRCRKQAYDNIAFCISQDPAIDVLFLPKLNLQQMQRGKLKCVRQLIQRLAPAQQHKAICAAMKRAGKIVIDQCSEYGTTLASAIPTVEITNPKTGKSYDCYEVKRIGASKMKPVPGYSNFEMMRDLSSCIALYHQLCTSNNFLAEILPLIKGKVFTQYFL